MELTSWVICIGVDSTERVGRPHRLEAWYSGRVQEYYVAVPPATGELRQEDCLNLEIQGPS